MRILAQRFMLAALVALVFTGAAFAEECFESREGVTKVEKTETAPGVPNVKCSPKTGGVLWWGDPYYGTQPMGEMPENAEADYLHGEAVVKPRTPQLTYYLPCSTCHNGSAVPYPRDKKPRALNMHQDIVPDALHLKHGKGAFWCLDCHNSTKRDMLVDHNGAPIDFNQPQKLCGKCHGDKLRDWRDGIHGKRTGSWKKEGKKRWWVCTECHNPHDVETAKFYPLKPETPPALPRGMHNADHERSEGH